MVDAAFAAAEDRQLSAFLHARRAADPAVTAQGEPEVIVHGDEKVGFAALQVG